MMLIVIVPIVMILDITVGTQILKTLRKFLCLGTAWLNMIKD